MWEQIITGKVISDYEYNALTSSEKLRYRRYVEISSKSNNDDDDGFTTPIAGTYLSSFDTSSSDTSSSDSSSDSSSSNDFGGFGGGDFGGGGASGDF